MICQVLKRTQVTELMVPDQQYLDCSTAPVTPVVHRQQANAGDQLDRSSIFPHMGLVHLSDIFKWCPAPALQKSIVRQLCSCSYENPSFDVHRDILTHEMCLDT